MSYLNVSARMRIFSCSEQKKVTVILEVIKRKTATWVLAPKPWRQVFFSAFK